MKHADALTAAARKTVLTLTEVQARYAHVTDDRERLYVLADVLDAVDKGETALAGMEWDYSTPIERRDDTQFDSALYNGREMPECGAVGCAIGFGKLLFQGWDSDDAVGDLYNRATADDIFFNVAGDPTPAMVATRIREALDR